MQVIFLLIFLGAVVAIGFLVAFFISIKNGQFDDDKTPAMRILFDDKPATDENLEQDHKD
jgi:cbb3-type cytochrome oxidase maturation protein